MLNCIIWNKTVLTLTLCFAKLAGAVEYTNHSSRELEFHVCSINKSAHMKKVWKLIEGISYIGLNLGSRRDVYHVNTE